MIKTLIKKDYLRPDEAAEYLSVGRKTIYRWIDEGKIEVVKIGNLIRIPQEQLTKILKKSSAT